MTAKKTPPALAGQRLAAASLGTAASGPLGIGDMLTAVQQSAAAPGEITVDIGAFMGAEEGQATLTLAELDAPRLFQAGADGKAIQRKNPDWPEALAASVALLALAHVSPASPGMPISAFYVQVAKSNRRLLMHLLKCYNKAFPEITDLEAGEDAAKND